MHARRPDVCNCLSSTLSDMLAVNRSDNERMKGFVLVGYSSWSFLSAMLYCKDDLYAKYVYSIYIK